MSNAYRLSALVLMLVLQGACGGDDNAGNESVAADSEDGSSTANPSAQLTAPSNAQPDFPSSLDEDEYDRLDDELDSLPDRVIPRVEDDDKLHFASTAEAQERIVDLIEAGKQVEADKVYASVDPRAQPGGRRATVKTTPYRIATSAFSESITAVSGNSTPSTSGVA